MRAPVRLTSPLQAQRQVLQNTPFDALQALAQPWLKLPEEIRSRRRRLFPLPQVFWLFLFQVLCVGCRCATALQTYGLWLAPAGGRVGSLDTGGYCRARKRLPEAALTALPEPMAEAIEAEVDPEELWCGREVDVVDGTTTSMPDTQANQAAYPQPKSQKEGCGFPLMRLVAVFSLCTGALRAYETGPESDAEGTLFRRLWGRLRHACVVLTDRGFCSFAHIGLLQQSGRDVVMRQHARRSTGLTEIRRLGPHDRIVEWHKGPDKDRPKWMPEAVWQALPDRLRLREVTVPLAVPGFRTKHLTLVTTLLDPQRYPIEALAELYFRRWRVELFFRDIKATMGMDVLRGKSPAMIRREVAMHFVAYNLVRALLYQAGRTRGVKPGRLSFTAGLRGLCESLRVLAAVPAEAAQDLVEILLTRRAQAVVPERPHRAEPRVRKRRPKNYPLLNKPRRQYKEIPHRNQYRKDRKA